MTVINVLSERKLLTVGEVKSMGPFQLTAKLGDSSVRTVLVAGGSEEFAKVYLRHLGCDLLLGEWCWSTIARCYNSGTPLIY